MKIHATAIANAKAYDERKGGQTMPPDVEAVWPVRKRQRNTKDMKKDQEIGRKPVMSDRVKYITEQYIAEQEALPQRPLPKQPAPPRTSYKSYHKTPDRSTIRIAGLTYSRRLCQQVYEDYRKGNADQDALARQYRLPKMVVHSIIRKGEWNKL